MVVDNTSFWRMHEDVPLVVAEVNPEAVEGHNGLIANPNCSTMQAMVALAPIQRAVGIERIVFSTYQSVSGTGQQRDPTSCAPSREAILDGKRPRGRGLPAPDRLQRRCRRSSRSTTATTTRPRSAR